MRVPDPEPGMVVRYDYLWRSEGLVGRDQGKTRPACIVGAKTETRPMEVLLLPITHVPPFPDSAGIEIPQILNRSIGLDDQPCWVVVSECNHDQWPNAGLSTIPGTSGHFHYGFIPPRLFSSIRNRFLDFARKGNVIVLRP